MALEIILRPNDSTIYSGSQVIGGSLAVGTEVVVGGAVTVAKSGSDGKVTNSGAGNLLLGTNDADSVAVGTTSVAPAVDNTLDMGEASKRWKVVYSATGTINTSDAKRKRDIEDLPETYGLEFVNLLRPRRYRFKDGDSGRVHFGLIAQEVEDLLSEGYGDPELMESSMVVKAVGEEGGVTYGLRYSELIPCLLKAVQSLSVKVEDLQIKLANSS